MFSVISASALAFQSLSALHLNLNLFGLLVYVEPILLVAVSNALGESITSAEWPTYIAISLAVFTLMLEGLRSFKKNRKLAT
ncbi:MAG: multidrug DMT transporter [Acinetobacter sp.]|nr:multidrug DMT transporter [Acinetobacter sp.]